MSHTGKSGCGIVVYDSPGGAESYKTSVPMPKWTSTTHSELYALRLGVRVALDSKRNALLICDSISALLSINTIEPQYEDHVNVIQRDLIRCNENNCIVQFMWVPSHVGICGNEKADTLAKAATMKSCPNPPVITLRQFKTILKNENKEEIRLTIDAERLNSYSINHYDKFENVKHIYGKGKMHTGPCDRLAARIRIGYRRVWEITYARTGRANPEHSCCVLCNREYANKLQHYISECPHLKPFRPQGKRFHELCLHFCNPENLYPILSIYPGLRM